MESEPQHQDQLWSNIHYFRSRMNALGFNTLGSEAAIVPVLIGEDDTAMAFWKGLWEEGIFTTPSVSPGVPPGEAIIRTSVNANHTREQLDKLLHAFEVVGKRFGIIP
jgi:8-amino-7-oxononanoate synthase